MDDGSHLDTALLGTLRMLPALDGQATLVATATGQGRLWELCLDAAGSTAASEASCASAAEAWGVALAARGFTPAMAIRSFPGAALRPRLDAQLLTSGPHRLHVRSRAPSLGEEPLEALLTIEAVREFSEREVVGVAASLQELLQSSNAHGEAISQLLQGPQDPVHLTGALRELALGARALHDRTAQVIQLLQYQDRASQLLRHAADQVLVLEKLLGVVEKGPRDVNRRVGALGRALPGDLEVLQPSDVQLF